MVFPELWGQGHLMEAGSLKELAKLSEAERVGEKYTAFPLLPTSSTMPVPPVGQTQQEAS